MNQIYTTFFFTRIKSKKKYLQLFIYSCKIRIVANKINGEKFIESITNKYVFMTICSETSSPVAKAQL